jgi:hypothetical protein
MSSQTRAHPRYALEIDAEVVFDRERLPVRTRDVSRGGLCFIAPVGLPLGKEITLNMALVFDEATFSEPLLLRARVVWCTGLGDTQFQVGTTFLGMTGESRAYLEMVLRYLKEGKTREREAAQAASDDDDDGEVFGR